MLPERKVLEADLDVMQFLRRHYVFIRKARDTSHQCLFFLGMLRCTTTRKGNEAVLDYFGFALEQVKALIGGVHIPDDKAYRHWQQQLATLPAAQQLEVKRALSLYTDWSRIFDVLGDLENFNATPGLRQSLVQFLADSRGEHKLDQVVIHWLPECLTFFRKNLALIWGAVILLAVALKVEAVRALLWNEGWGVLLPLALLLVPLLISRGWILYRRLASAEVVPFWDISGAAFRTFRYQALEPGRLIERWPKHDRLRREIAKGQLVKLGFYAAWWGVAFLVISVFYNLGAIGLGDSSLTVFMVFSLFYAVLILAHLVDFWEYLDPRPVRFLMLMVSFSGIAFLLLGYGREFFIFAFLLTSALYLYTYFRGRHSVSDLSIALVFIGLAAANLIGRHTYQQAIWTEEEGTPEVAWQRLGPGEWPWPGKPDGSGPPIVVLAASGGGSRAAVYTGLVLDKLNEDYPQIARQIQAISSVSGGSLANAAYTVRLLELKEQSADPKARLRTLDGLNKELGSDFLFPTLLGALLPGMSRGKAIEENWQDKDGIGLREHRLSTLADQWRSELSRRAPHPPFPIPLFNTSTLDGHDVVFSPLKKELYSPDAMDREARSQKTNEYFQAVSDDAYTWVYYRDGIYGLEDLLGNFDPLLSQSVRASANFPFGFPLVRIQTERPLFFSPGGYNDEEKRVDLTDGGALSNSGMWSLYHLLVPDEKERLDSLKKRGVLLIIVEASKMPVYPRLEQSLNSLWSTIGDQGPVGQHLHRLMFDMLQEKYGDQIAIVQLDIVPRQSYNVLTSWALDKRSHERLLSSFERRWDEERKLLDASWRILHDRAQRGDHRLVTRRRPPLD